MNIDRPHNKAELGAWLSKKYWNKGIMTKALKRIMKYGFNSVKLNRIYGQIFTFNKASQRMAEKAGLKLEGRLRKSVRKKGRYYDDLMYAKVR